MSARAKIARIEEMDECGIARCVEVSEPIDGYITIALATIWEIGEEPQVTHVSMPSRMATMLGACLFAAMHGVPKAQP